MFWRILVRRTLDMKKIPFIKFSLMALTIFLTLYATTNIVSADGWTSEPFLYLDKDTAAIAFDARNNLYIQPLTPIFAQCKIMPDN